MSNLDLSKIKKIFFIGIGGIGISALAKMAISRGIEVSGVNDEESPKTLNSLREAGAEIFFLPAQAGQKDLKELPQADLYVYSDAWLHRGPEIIENAKKGGKPVINYFEALGEFAKDYKVIAIAGTHGKTTTTAMVAEILIEAGLDPMVIVGSFVKKLGSNFKKGDSKYLVVEADEYNRHFLSLNPFLSVVLNIEADHLDYYKDLKDIQDAFNKFLSQSQNKILDYQKYLEKVPKLLVPGIHNRMDAAAALAVVDFLHVKEEVAVKTLAEFSGTWRRLEKRGETAQGTIIYDDYAHHPTEIRASLQGLRELYPKGKKRVIILFQPHLYSRTRALFNDFTKCFEDADQILLLPIYFAREDKDISISSEKLAEAIDKTGKNTRPFSSFEEAETHIKALNLGPNDIFVTMGAGEAYKVADKVFSFT
ncbi:MAG: UDP-N-acetylmuramate-L-alanine ligase [Candidatus Nomurabacteria bacterium GW2011_GWB1_40_7]|uniref:UDP-N-acetylmuramate-L-alanine ligase n=1 Tax=Candidatus Nomurabacteria bacterium GW2011_GWB1_40_7 TaxID=1618744 RepID=A0A0G0SZJ7_9BACT|nr:MAG: UDP-N-acetylmuramate-L-alanine ligase [Candidatus Nomurabacteria bacterium GW2011_GWB1_40_7]